MVEALILSSTGLNIAVDEVRIVGSYKKGTMLAGHPVADMVIILKETPGGLCCYFFVRNVGWVSFRSIYLLDLFETPY